MRGAAKAHKAIFERLVASDGRTITVRFPVAPSTASNTVEMVRGKHSDLEAFGDTHDLTALWSTDVSTTGGAFASTANLELIARLGKTEKLDVIARLCLADTLVDPTKRDGKTYFDVAKDIVCDGTRYVVSGMSRGGMSPLAPYILYVGLRREGEL